MLKEEWAAELWARHQINELLSLYARGCDRHDPSLFHKIFWEDSQFEGGPMDGAPYYLMASPEFGKMMGTCFSMTQHTMSNSLIEFENDVAFGETYFVAYHFTRPTRESAERVLGAERLANFGDDHTRIYRLAIGGRYLDRFENRKGAWRIGHRKLIVDWSDYSLQADKFVGGVTDYILIRGELGQTDISSTWLPSARSSRFK